MIASSLLWYLLVPLFFTILTFLFFHKFISDQGDTNPWRDSLLFSAGGLLISAIIVSCAFYIARGSVTADVEILNGQVTNKTRVHGSYIRTYPCNCQTVTVGSSTTTVCSTCFEDHYTVDWTCQSTIGDIQIDYADWTSRSVYNLPDPKLYSVLKNGDPVSRPHRYTNYIKGVPDTLFKPASAELKTKYADKLPEYPVIYDVYKVNRVIPVGVVVNNIAEWNKHLSEALRTLGPTKQVNVVVILAKENTDFFYALQDAWINGKKNDAVVVIGIDDLSKPAKWVKIMALTEDSMFQIKLRDDIMGLSKLDSKNVIDTISKDVSSNFHRRSMKDFDYLNDEIDPPAWVMNTTIIIISLFYIGFWIFMFLNRKKAQQLRRSFNIYE